MFEREPARLLEAMGYTLLQRVAVAPPAGAAPAQVEQAPAPKPAVPRNPDKLWQAVLAAASLDDARAAECLLYCASDGQPFAFNGAELHIDPAALRRAPNAKRALWKTLRALRRRELGRGR